MGANAKTNCMLARRAMRRSANLVETPIAYLSSVGLLSGATRITNRVHFTAYPIALVEAEPWWATGVSAMRTITVLFAKSISHHRHHRRLLARRLTISKRAVLAYQRHSERKIYQWRAFISVTASTSSCPYLWWLESSSSSLFAL